MKISTRGRYALRLMLDLAEHGGSGPVRLRDAAQRQALSEKYLEQIISALRGAGYVRSVRGPQGGYVLCRPPESYTVGMILRLTEGSLSPVECVGDGANPCARADGCTARLLWEKLDSAIRGVVDHVTLQDLLEHR